MIYKPGSVRLSILKLIEWMTIHLGRLLPAASRNLPERQRENTPTEAVSISVCHSYLVLLPMGFTMPDPLLELRCALTTPFHPYQRLKSQAVYFLWHFP